MASQTATQLASPPTTEEIALTLLQWLFASIGAPTDANIGSIIRTYSEAIGSIGEIESVSAQAQAFQALVYSALAVFGVTPLGSSPSGGNVTFSTQSGQPVPGNVSIVIPQGTLLQTSNSIQFQTTASAILVSGATSIDTTVISTVGGSATNVAAGAISQVLTGLAYPLIVTNPLPTIGGTDAETVSQTLTRFVSLVQSLGLGSPVAIANAVVGVSYGNEVVHFSSCFENWISQVLIGQSPTPGFQVYIDNGSGTASTNLINTVYDYLSNGGIVGYRPAGVPYSVQEVNKVIANVSITAVAVNSSLAGGLQTAITSAVQAYFQSVNFGGTVQQTNIVAVTADAAAGELQSLSVILTNSISQVVSQITSDGTQRIILSTLIVTVS